MAQLVTYEDEKQNVFHRVKKFIARKGVGKMVNLSILVLLLAALPLAVFLTSQQQELRQRATEKQSPAAAVTTASLQLLALNKQYHTDSESQKTQLLQQMMDLAQQRRKNLATLFTQDPHAAASAVFPPKITHQLPPQVQSNLESETSLEGTIGTTISDDFAHQTSHINYSLTDTTGAQFTLLFADQAINEEPVAFNGSKVKVKGMKLDNKILLASSQNDDFIITNGAPSAHTVLGVSTVKKVVYLLFNFAESPATPFTTDAMRQMGFTSTGGGSIDSATYIPSVANYYKEASFGQLTQTGKVRNDGDVYGWYTIADSPSAGCNYAAWATSVDAAANAAGVDLTGYDNIVYVYTLANTALDPCGFTGIADLPGIRSWINAAFTATPSYIVTTAEHEIGHNYGEQHSNLYFCKDASGNPVAISTTCISGEYGDHFDVMGNSNYTSHFSMYHKARLGFITTGSPNSTDVPLTNGTYTYIIAPLEQAASTAQVVRIPRDFTTAKGKTSVTSYYYVDYRQPIGYTETHTANFSGNLSLDPPASIFQGVTIHLNSDYAVGAKTQLINTHPGTRSGDQATANKPSLQVNETFYDPIKNISITTTAISPTGATIKVVRGTPPCTPASPIISISPRSQYGQFGEGVPYNLTITNTNSGCPISNLAVNYNPVSTQADYTPEIVNDHTTIPVSLAAGATTTVPITVYSDNRYLIPSQTNSFEVFVSDASFPGYYSSATADYITYAGISDTIAPFVKITNPVQGSTVQGVVTIQFCGTDYSGVSKAEYLIDGTLIASYPYQPVLAGGCVNPTWDTTRYPDGNHTLTVTYTDPAGNIGKATSQITVANGGPVDTTAPTTAITSPSANQTVSGIIAVTASASDTVGVTSVDLYVNNTFVSRNSSGPYVFNWDTTSFANGSYSLTTKAYDAAGNVGTSPTVIVTVNNTTLSPSPTPLAVDTTAPIVSITNPTNGTVVARQNIVPLLASASDNVGVMQVQFFVNNSLVCSVPAAPYSCSWEVPSKPKVIYTIMAKVSDAAGNTSTSTISVRSQ